MEFFLKISRIRWEVIFIYNLVFFLVLILDFFFPENLVLSKPFTLLILLLFYLFLAFILGFFIEFFYVIFKILSTLLLRLGNFWKYSIPSLLVFLLIIYPLFDLTELKNFYINLEGLRGNFYIVIIGMLILFSIFMIFFFPIFYGLNGGFVIVSSLISYNLIKVLVYTFHLKLSFFIFLVLYYFLSFLLFIFFQVRRRFALNIIYENFEYPNFVIFLFLLFSVASLIYRILFNSGFVSLFFITLFNFFIIVNLILIVIINYESKINKQIFKINFIKFFIIFLLNILLGIVFFINFDYKITQYFEKSKRTWISYIFHFAHFIYDKDKDGENNLFANDLEDHDVYSRKEGKYKPKVEIVLPELKKNNIINYILITIYLRNNPYSTDEYYLSSSNDIQKTLFSLFNYTSSYETHFLLNQNNNELIKTKGILTYLTENYFRTICVGYVAQNSYFFANSNYKLDKGCEIIENIKEPYLSLLKESLTDFFERSLYYINSYKTNKNFIWLHWDVKNYKNNLQKSELIDLVMNFSFNQNIYFPTKKILFLFYDHSIPYYEVYTDIEKANPMLDRKFTYYGTLYRLILYNELKSNNEDLFKNEFFFNEYKNSVEQNINDFIFIEPEDLYWKELILYFGKPTIPPISIHSKDKKIYDGRWGVFLN